MNAILDKLHEVGLQRHLKERNFSSWTFEINCCFNLRPSRPAQCCSRVGSTRGSGRVGSGRVRNIDKNGGSGRVGSRPWRVGSGPSTVIRPDPPCFSKPVNVNFDSDTQSTLCKLFPIIHRNLRHA